MASLRNPVRPSLLGTPLRSVRLPRAFPRNPSRVAPTATVVTKAGHSPVILLPSRLPTRCVGGAGGKSTRRHERGDTAERTPLPQGGRGARNLLPGLVHAERSLAVAGSSESQGRPAPGTRRRSPFLTLPEPGLSDDPRGPAAPQRAVTGAPEGRPRRLARRTRIIATPIPAAPAAPKSTQAGTSAPVSMPTASGGSRSSAAK